MVGAAGTSAGRVLLVSAGPFFSLPPAMFAIASGAMVAVAVSPTATVVQKGAASRHGGVPLKKEARESDCFMTSWRKTDYLAHIGADVRLPGPVGLIAGVINVAGRVG